MADKIKVKYVETIYGNRECYIGVNNDGYFALEGGVWYRCSKDYEKSHMIPSEYIEMIPKRSIKEGPTEEECFVHDCSAIFNLSQHVYNDFIKVRMSKGKGNRQSLFVYELLQAIENFTFIAEADNQRSLHPDYALEKLGKAKRFIEAAEGYFKAVADEASRQAEIKGGK